MFNLILFGPPGSGKGTQSDKLVEKYGLKHLSTGNLLRQEIADKTQLGLEAKSFIDKGQLVPDEVVIGMVDSFFDLHKDAKGFLFDGFPRTIPQAESLDEILNRMGLNLNSVLSVQVPQKIIVERLAGRRTCRKCGALCHVIFNPPKQTGVCDRCGGELYQRADDQEIGRAHV